MINKAKLFEDFVALYLRLNGYFSNGFIVHSHIRNQVRSEVDLLSCRFPKHVEPERKMGTCPYLAIPTETIDLIVGEVKTGRRPAFNLNLRSDNDLLRSVFYRFGLFEGSQIEEIIKNIAPKLDPRAIRNTEIFPCYHSAFATNTGSMNFSLRFILFTNLTRPAEGNCRPFIYQDDMMRYVRNCLCPENTRESCATRYNFELWGTQFTPIVDYFKKTSAKDCEIFDDICKYLEKSNKEKVA